MWVSVGESGGGGVSGDLLPGTHALLAASDDLAECAVVRHAAHRHHVAGLAVAATLAAGVEESIVSLTCRTNRELLDCQHKPRRELNGQQNFARKVESVDKTVEEDR